MNQDLLIINRELVADSGRYIVVKSLGVAGATSSVFLLNRKQDRQPFALKLMRAGISPELQQHFRDEMVNLQRLRFAENSYGTTHIPRIIESSDLQQPKTQDLLKILGRPFIIMDFVPGTDVETLLLERNILHEAEALEITRQLAEVLVVIHGEGFTYTDMKLSNLFWDEDHRHLMVIDWNVIALHRLESDSLKDCLRAAGYLFQMVTGLPIRFNDMCTGIVDQKFRRWSYFKNLTEGTRFFLIKAFHPNITSRHGSGGDPAECTKEFLNELSAHVERFKFPVKDLVEKGQGAFNDRQWQEALFYLDLAFHQSEFRDDDPQSAELQNTLEKARQEAGKLGRGSFFSGYSRYKNGLYIDAKADFEKAMLDDPFDVEARLFAIVSCYAEDAGEESYLTVKDTLEECSRALLRNNLDVASNALNRLPVEALSHPAVASLKAEIDTRIALNIGQDLLKEDRLDEAREAFNTANRQKNRLLYVETLEENLGSLLQFCHSVEDLKKLYSDGDAYLSEERFQEAAWIFSKARTISGGSALANKKYETARRLYEIKKLLEGKFIEKALEECNKAATRVGDQPLFFNLKNRVIDSRCLQLLELADKANIDKDYNNAQTLLKEFLKWKPNDKAVKTKLQDIDSEIAGICVNEIRQLDIALVKDSSIEACEQNIIYIENKGFTQFKEGALFLKKVEELKGKLDKTSREYADAVSSGNLEDQKKLLVLAIDKRWKLKQGDPVELMKNLEPKLRERDLTRIDEHIMYSRPKDALELCENLLCTELPAEKADEIRKKMKTAHELDTALNNLEFLKKQKSLFSTADANFPFQKLKLEKEYLCALREMKQVVPQLEAPRDVKEYEKKLENLSRDLSDHLLATSRNAEIYLANCDITSCKKSSLEIHEIISLLEDSIEIERWKTWIAEFDRWVKFLEYNPIIADATTNYRWMLGKLVGLVENPQVKEIIASFEDVPLEEIETNPDQLIAISALINDSPIAYWLHQFFRNRINIARLWSLMDENPKSAREFFESNFGPGQKSPFEKSLQVVQDIESCFSQFETGMTGTTTAAFNLEYLHEMVKASKDLLDRLQNIPQMKGKQTETRLRKHISLLQQQIAERKKVAIDELSGKLEQRISKLADMYENSESRAVFQEETQSEIEALRDLDPVTADRFEKRLQERSEEVKNEQRLTLISKQKEVLEDYFKRILETSEDHMERSKLENLSLEQIEKIREISNEEAIKYNTRLNDILEQMAKALLSKPSLEKFKTLMELQRQVCERWKDNQNFDLKKVLNDFSKETRFKEVIPDYIKWHENSLRELKHLPRDIDDKRIQALREIREKYGEFPEIENDFQKIREEISRKKTLEAFNRLVKDFSEACIEKEWKDIDTRLSEVNTAFLPDTEREQYSRMMEEIQLRTILGQPLRHDDLVAFLNTGRNETVDFWFKAMDWNLSQKKGEIDLHPQTLINIETSELKWLEKQHLNLEGLGRLRCLRSLIQKIPPSNNASNKSLEASNSSGTVLNTKNQSNPSPSGKNGPKKKEKNFRNKSH